MTEKVAVFIDGANLFRGLITDFNRFDIDYQLAVNKLLKGRTLTRVYYYTAAPIQHKEPDRYAKQQRFFAALGKLPYFKVVLGRLEARGDTYVEKGVDIAMAIDIVDQAYRNIFDTAILITGDGDFSRAVEIAQHQGKHVESASPKSCMSRDLQQKCDVNIVLDEEFVKDCWRNKKK